MSDDEETAAPDDTRDVRAGRAAFKVNVSAEARSARYERGKEIARGGLGRITSALDRTLQREVAIKELHERTEQGMRRFVREGLTTARLQHPAIVPVFDAGTWEGGDPFLVMKLLAGRTLSEELIGRRTTEQRLALLPNLLAVADALGYAHEQGVIHRDVKPSNIMIGTHGETVLLDWGIAHDGSARDLESEGKGRGPEPVIVPSSDEPLTVAGTLAGTMKYMSPEQARGEPPVPGFDVYSLGVTIASVLRGRSPVSDDDPLPDDVPADLVAIVRKATSTERYAHAGLLADDLRQFIAGKLVSARRYTRVQLLRRWVQRHRILVGALAVVAVIAVIAVRGIVHERNLAIAEREAAEARERDLVLLQARANLTSDPTATIAWLKAYPIDAPHQDEVLALADEAEGRGVAKHVWRAASQTSSFDFTRDGHLAIANRDGSLALADLATGERRALGNAGRPLRYVCAAPGDVFALDADNTVYRATAAGLDKRQSVPGARATGFYYIPETRQLKLTYNVDDASLVAIDSLAAPITDPLPKLEADADYTDDEFSASDTYAVRPDGHLYVIDKAGARELAAFAPNTWVRASMDGRAYAVVVPGPGGRGDRATVWLAEPGAAPVEVGEMRACGPGEDRDETGEVSDDGKVTMIARCGMMAVFAHGETRVIDDAEGITAYALARDGHWLALGRNGGLELVDLVTGAARELAGGASVSNTVLSDDGAWVATSGGTQGTRVWPLAPLAVTRLGERTAPTVIVGDGDTIMRHLQCMRWSDRGVAAWGIDALDARDVDSENLLWPQDVAADGHACVFAGHDGTAIVVRDDGSRRTYTHAGASLDNCVLDGTRVVCATQEPSIVTLDPGESTRALDGKPRDLARYRDHVVALVEREDGCEIETAGGDKLVALPGRTDCRALRPSSDALVVERAASVDVWAGGDVLTIQTENVRVEASKDYIAAPREQTVEIWSRATGQRRDGPPPHAHAVEHVAWSPAGILASADDETIQLWDPASGLVRIRYAPHTRSLRWASATTLVVTDGRTIQRLAIDLTRGSSPSDVRARLDALTTARIVDGQVATP